MHAQSMGMRTCLYECVCDCVCAHMCPSMHTRSSRVPIGPNHVTALASDAIDTCTSTPLFTAKNPVSATAGRMRVCVICMYVCCRTSDCLECVHFLCSDAVSGQSVELLDRLLKVRPRDLSLHTVRHVTYICVSICHLCLCSASMCACVCACVYGCVHMAPHLGAKVRSPPVLCVGLRQAEAEDDVLQCRNDLRKRRTRLRVLAPARRDQSSKRRWNLSAA